MGRTSIRRRSRLRECHDITTIPASYTDDSAQSPYINLLAAMLLLTSPPAAAFLSLVNLLSRPCLHAFHTETTDEIEAYYRVFENLQADTFPKIYANCKNLGLRLPESYFRAVLVEQVPFEACCRLWDQVGRFSACFLQCRFNVFCTACRSSSMEMASSFARPWRSSASSNPGKPLIKAEIWPY